MSRPRNPLLDDAGWLRERYVEAGLTTEAIAAELGCGRATVGDALRRLGIGARPSGPPRPALLDDVEWLRERYAAGTSVTVAAEVGCSSSSVIAALREHAIPVMPLGQGNLRHAHAVGGELTRTYRSWASMVQRCTNPKATCWAYYGGRGIGVCERWRQFDNFLADMGERPDGMSLDRIDNDGNYEPGNCRWATAREQAQNQRRARA